MIDGDDKLDLSALDPERDGARWRAVVDRTRSGVHAALDERANRQQDAFGMIASWRRTLLVAAAAVLAVLIPAEITLERREARAESIHRLAVLSAASVRLDRVPTAAEILETIAEENRR